MHEFFLTKKDVSVGIFPSVVNNSAQLIFKNSLQEFSKKKKTQHNPEHKKLATQLFSGYCSRDEV